MADPVWTVPASLFAGLRTIGGTLALTPDALVFTAGAPDAAVPDGVLTIALADVKDVRATARNWFGQRRHLILEVADGTWPKFLVDDVKRLVRDVRDRLPSR